MRVYPTISARVGMFLLWLDKHPDVHNERRPLGTILTTSSPLGQSYVQEIRHPDPLFDIAGTLVLLLFIGIVWLWAKERIALKGSSTTAADFKLTGYVFMLMAAWFT